MQRVRAKEPARKVPVTVLLADQVDFGAAPGHPEPVRFDDARRASRVSRLSPKPFRFVGLDLQTKRERRQEIHPPTKSLRYCPVCKRTSQKRAPRSDNV